MTLRKILAQFGVQLEHIYRFNPDGSFMARITQVGQTELPVSGLLHAKVLPYFDADMRIVYRKNELIERIEFQGGDFSEKYTLIVDTGILVKSE